MQPDEDTNPFILMDNIRVETLSKLLSHILDHYKRSEETTQSTLLCR